MISLLQAINNILAASENLEDLTNALESVSVDEVRVTGHDQLFSFKEPLTIQEYRVAESSTHPISSDAVPSGEIWVVTAMSAFNITSPCDLIYLCKHTGGLRLRFAASLNPAIREGPNLQGQHIFCEEGDVVEAVLGGLTVGDGTYLNASGYKMSIE
jgi:hypothetical protein